MLSILYWVKEIFPYYSIVESLFTLVMVLYLLNTDIDPTAKITWLVIIMLLPAFGALLLWYTQSDLGNRLARKRLNNLFALTQNSILQDSQVADALSAQDRGAAALAQYMRHTGCHPVFHQTEVTYFPSGKAKWKEMLIQLKRAKHFIFLEYFIIEEGLMWGSILEILAQ